METFVRSAESKWHHETCRHIAALAGEVEIAMVTSVTELPDASGLCTHCIDADAGI